MLRFRPEARVGLVIFLGIIALIGTYWFLRGSIARGRTYTIYAVFRSVQKLDKGASVRMAGVPVGEVYSIALTRDNLARLELRIRDGVRIPKGSVVRLTSGTLVGDVYVEVVPGHLPGYVGENKTIRGEDTVTLDQLMPQASQLLAQLQATAQALNSILGDKRMIAAMRNSMTNTENATRQAAGLMKDFRILAAQNSDELNAALSNAAKASADFASVAESMRGVLEKSGSKDIRAMLESGKVAAANLQAASQKLKELAEDQQLNTDLRATVSNLRKTSENAEVLSEKLSKILGGKKPPGGEKPHVRGEGTVLDVYRDFGQGDFRVDYNLTLPTAKDKFYRVGLFGIGDSTKLNVQPGRMVTSDFSVRYGLYASRLGVGVDKYFGRTSLHADLYDLNNPMLEIKGRYDLKDDFGVWAGLNDLLDDRQLLLGVQYRK